MRPLGFSGPGQAWLCSGGGTTDFSMKQLAEGSTLKLAKHVGSECWWAPGCWVLPLEGLTPTLPYHHVAALIHLQVAE